MMKYLVLLMLGCLPILVSAQDKRDDRNRHLEIGLNSTQLLRNLFAQNPTGSNGTHTLFMKYGWGNGYFRALLGGKVENKESEDLLTGSPFVSNSVEFRTALGYEKRRPIYKKLELVMGFDFLFGLTQASSKSSFRSPVSVDVFEVKSTTTSLGGGPILGLRYAFSKFFAVSTESSLYILGSKGAKVNTSNGQEGNRKDFTTLVVGHSLPTDLFVVVTF